MDKQDKILRIIEALEKKTKEGQIRWFLEENEYNTNLENGCVYRISRTTDYVVSRVTLQFSIGMPHYPYLIQYLDGDRNKVLNDFYETVSQTVTRQTTLLANSVLEGCFAAIQN